MHSSTRHHCFEWGRSGQHGQANIASNIEGNPMISMPSDGVQEMANRLRQDCALDASNQRLPTPALKVHHSLTQTLACCIE
jgi:hypothetical protein